MRILFLGDVVGSVGREALNKIMPQLKAELAPSFTIVNGENSAGGLGITAETANEIFKAGADFITTGNHVWNKKEVYPYLEKHQDRIIRPLNAAEGAPGAGFAIVPVAGVRLLIVNALGRVFMNDLVECPFRTVERLLNNERDNYDVSLLDFHAEATSEKIAIGYFLSNKISAVVGTHTHVQTADERLLHGTTAYISDVGMCGPYESVIGVEVDLIVKRFYSGLPERFSVAKGPAIICGVVIDVDEHSGNATAISRIQKVI